MSDYLNGLRIVGEPKTVNLVATWKGVTKAAPLEVWFAAFFAALPDECKCKAFGMIDQFMESREAQRNLNARIVADIQLPPLGG